MKRFDLSKIMSKAWSIFRAAAKKTAITFSAALTLAWKWAKVQQGNAAKVENAAKEAGYGDIVCHSWSGWKSLGRMVCHTEQAAFKVTVADPTAKSGFRTKAYFAYDQTQPLPA